MGEPCRREGIKAMAALPSLDQLRVRSSAWSGRRRKSPHRHRAAAQLAAFHGLCGERSRLEFREFLTRNQGALPRTGVKKMADINKLVDQLSELTVLEAADLAKALEEKWGFRPLPRSRLSGCRRRCGPVEEERPSRRDPTGDAAKRLTSSRKSARLPSSASAKPSPGGRRTQAIRKASKGRSRENQGADEAAAAPSNLSNRATARVGRRLRRKAHAVGPRPARV